ncbi:MAG: helix-turn-helix domain-containing protein [Magnetococcus sp. YQC-3]
MSIIPQPNLIAVAPLAGYRLHLRWREHGEDQVDLSSWIEQWGSTNNPFLEPAFFAAVRVGEYGWSVVWSEDIAIDSEHLYRLARYQAQESLAPETLRAWRARHGMSRDELAQLLGISDLMVQSYEEGRYMIPETVLLACKKHDAPQGEQAA